MHLIDPADLYHCNYIKRNNHDYYGVQGTFSDRNSIFFFSKEITLCPSFDMCHFKMVED